MIQVTVQSAFIAGAWCAEIRVPPPHGAGTLFVQEKRKASMERAVHRALRALPKTDLIAVKWHELGSIL
jgi:hypothetical protein